MESTPLATTPAPTTPPSVRPPLTPLPPRSPLRRAVAALTRVPEPELLPGLLAEARLGPEQAAQVQREALALAAGVRAHRHGHGSAGLVQGLLQAFALSSQEGVALMCLAEALLRIPDDATRDALIRDKIGEGDWEHHLGRSPSLFVNAAAWGLLLTGKLVATHSDRGLGATLRRLVARGGEPLIRRGVDLAMRLMGEQFVTGETIEQALANAREREERGFRFSYDMLGEAALTEADAQRYFEAYRHAIEAIGQAAAGRGLVDGPGISIKLSALHPRYARAQVERVHAELLPRLVALARRARAHDIGLNIDAEEADRLELSLDLLEALCHEPGLAGWHGVGFVVQAYQKRAPAVIDLLIDLARRSGHRLMVRLVKGAYWDSEIKRAQLDGLAGYPVYTRKAYTDVAYLACARRLLAAPEAVYPQFATHNAHTCAAVMALAGPQWAPGQYEFQCLHGMGEPLYEQLAGRRPCRIYAPVGTHETLLAYLVRRLLENGANTSFVHRIADATLPLEELVRDPVATVEAMAAAEGVCGAPHPAIALPAALYGRTRVNSRGLDLADEGVLATLQQALAEDAGRPWRSGPIVAGEAAAGGSDSAALAEAEARAEAVNDAFAVAGDDAPAAAGDDALVSAVRNPADPQDVVGTVVESPPAALEAALRAAAALAASTDAEAWPRWPAPRRAAVLEAAADALEAATLQLVPLLVREAGKTCANAVGEVREAVDFLRDNAATLRRDLDGAATEPLGPVLCISPWNFPLAIFIGQVAAALAAGNVVLAKPAEQTPLVAAEAVRALHAAGVPRAALQLLPGRGETVGAALVADARVQGVLFTGSTEVARLLQATLARRLDARGRPVTLVAETGGQNALIVDSSALAEQAVADAVASAFDSAGQRCSALRLLCVQAEVAERVFAMLRGAVQALGIGDPRRLATDVGPLIDAEAAQAVERHVQAMRARGHAVWRAELPAAVQAAVQAAVGHGAPFVAPTLIEIGAVADLGREVFGPVLHLLRFRREDLPALLAQINATGYALTQGVHTRIDETIAQVAATARAGNLYVNRNIVGAVVGVQPFGGEGLSGTGPKAGGPLYLLRLLARRPGSAARLAVARRAVAPAARTPLPAADEAPGPQGAAALPRGSLQADEAAGTAHAWGALSAVSAVSASAAAQAALRDWAVAAGRQVLLACCDLYPGESPVCDWLTLAGPTGQADLYAVRPRHAVLGLADDEADRLTQLAAVLAVGARMVWPTGAQALHARLPEAVRERIDLVPDWRSLEVRFDAVLLHGDAATILATQQALAARPGPIVTLTALAPGALDIPLERLVTERSLSINTAAAGGNASLMAID